MSAVLEQQVSEGYPADGRIFEPPQINRDNEKPRYLTFLGSMVDPEIARSRPWTKSGGIDVSNPCLRYVKNFLRKGRITPMLKDTHDFLPYDLVKKTTEIDPLAAGYFAQPIPVGYVPPALPPANGQFQPGFGNIAVGGPSPYGNLVGKLALPGEQINSILIGSENMAQNNVPRGIVEHKSLIGQPYTPQQVGEMYVDPAIWAIQKAIFPSYPVLPVLLDDLERLLDEAETHLSLRSIVDDYRESVLQFRDYANATIQKVHHEMRESASRQGYIFRYTSMDLILLEQLGMDRQDREIRKSATAPNSKLEGMFEQWLAIQIEEKQANLDRMKRTGEIDASTMAAAPIADEGFPGYSGFSGYSGEVMSNVSSEGVEQMGQQMADVEPIALEPTTYACDACDHAPFDTPQGLSMHRSRWCGKGEV